MCSMLVILTPEGYSGSHQFVQIPGVLWRRDRSSNHQTPRGFITGECITQNLILPFHSLTQNHFVGTYRHTPCHISLSADETPAHVQTNISDSCICSWQLQ